VGGRPELVIYRFGYSVSNLPDYFILLQILLTCGIDVVGRIATDLNLHQASTTKAQTENQEREVLNRTRVWMICFNLDRSTATQFGKPTTIKED
jgi:hypothetical protein